MSKSKSRMSHATPASSRKGLDQLHPPDKNNNNASSSRMAKDAFKKSKDYEKYSLRPRSIQNRIETEKRQKGELKKEPKPKQKPPPLSKYRRKTANARERSRMREINTAYELLQAAVPQYPVLPTNAQGKTCEKLTKITTLRLAMNYIQTLQSLLTQPEGGGRAAAVAAAAASSAALLSSSSNDIESDTDSIGNSIASSSASPSCGSSSGSGNGLGSGSEFSPASSYTMSPMSSCSPVGPDCIQTVMRSVVSPAAAAAISANAANLNSLNLNNVSLSSLTSSPASLGIVAPHQSITTIVTIPSHPHAQAQYSRQLPPNIQHHHQTPQQTQSQPQIQHHHYHTLPPPPRPPQAVTSSSSSSPSYIVLSSAAPSSIQLHHQNQHQHQLHHHHHQQKLQFQTSVSANPSSQRNPLLCSAQQAILVSSNNSARNYTNNAAPPHSGGNISMSKMKLPPIATSLSSALLRKSMSSFLTDCVQLTNGVSVSMNSIIGCNDPASGNNGNRTGSLSSLTESDLSEYTNDLLSDEGSVLDEPMFEDIIGVGATDLDLLLGTESLGFPTADLSAI